MMRRWLLLLLVMMMQPAVNVVIVRVVIDGILIRWRSGSFAALVVAVVPAVSIIDKETSGSGGHRLSLFVRWDYFFHFFIR